MFPTADTDFRETTLTDVRGEAGGGHSITGEDGWSFFVPAGAPVAPRAGMAARFYGRGIGYAVRGLFLDGVKVFYRTAAEQAEHEEIQLYGRDAADWLARWDAGRIVWSVAVGGFGPGYEQAIQIAAVELVRFLLAEDFEPTTLRINWENTRRVIEAHGFSHPVIVRLQLSGMQWGAALSLALQIFERGPRAALRDPFVKDRQIQISKHFPSAS